MTVEPGESLFEHFVVRRVAGAAEARFKRHLLGTKVTKTVDDFGVAGAGPRPFVERINAAVVDSDDNDLAACRMAAGGVAECAQEIVERQAEFDQADAQADQRCPQQNCPPGEPGDRGVSRRARPHIFVLDGISHRNV